jgi:glycosyltransferase involved in cell wall biosynthesis
LVKGIYNLIQELAQVTMKILFLAPYPLGESPSQRFRFEQYFEILIQTGHSFDHQSFLDSGGWKLFFQKGRPVMKFFFLVKGFLKRVSILFKLSSYSIIFIHREAAPIGPPIIEWMIAKLFRKKIIYDFDDAIWLTDRKNESIILKTLKWRSKVQSICRWSYKVSCGNEYLCAYARQFNNQVFYNPTTIDTENLHNPTLYKINRENKIVVGWTGSHSTLKYLNDLEPVLQTLEQKYPQMQINIISDVAPKLNLRSLHFKPWSLVTELHNLAQFDIGIMPLPDDEWSKGKCGFKALQYMALQIPTVVSPVGVNNQIVRHSENGFLCSKTGEWESCISILVENKTLRDSMGVSGRKNVVDHYSVSSNASNFLSLFSSLSTSTSHIA